MASGATSASVATDAAGWFTSVSPQFLTLIDRPVESLAGVNFVDLVHPGDVATVRRTLAAASGSETANPVVARLFVAGETWSQTELTITVMADDRRQIAMATIDDSEANHAPDDIADRRAAADHAPDDIADRRADANHAPDDIADRRAAVRAAAGSPDTPMLEIDPDGRTVYVAGNWEELGDTEQSGAEVFESLLARSEAAPAILDAIDRICGGGPPSRHELRAAGAPPRWVRIDPIPSPYRRDRAHALVRVVRESELGASESSASGPASRVVQGRASADPSPDGESIETSLDDGSPVDGADIDRENRVRADVDIDDASGQVAAGRRSAAARLTRLLVWGLVAAIAIVAVLDLTRGGSDDPVPPEPVTAAITSTEAVRVGDIQMWRPIGVEPLVEVYAITSFGDGAVVADIEGRVVRLDDQGASVEVSGLTSGQEAFVSDIVALETGRVWILDAGAGQVSELRADGSISRLDSDSNLLRNARGLGAGADGTVWVASTAAAQLTRLAADGALVETLPLPGRQPSDVVQLDDGSLWFVDAQDIELVRISQTGELLTTISLEPFSSVQAPHLAVSGDLLWVTEPDGSAVFAVDLSTGQVSSERIQISRPDGSPIVRPIGIDIGADGRFWIVDSLGGAVVIVDP